MALFLRSEGLALAFRAVVDYAADVHISSRGGGLEKLRDPALRFFRSFPSNKRQTSHEVTRTPSQAQSVRCSAPDVRGKSPFRYPWRTNSVKASYARANSENFAICVAGYTGLSPIIGCRR